MERKKIKIGITQGDINGIGFEVIIKTFSDPQILDICTPIIYGSPKAAAFHRKSLDIQSFNLNVISNTKEAHAKKVNIINCSDDDVKVELASTSPEAGAAAQASLEMATKDAKEGLIDAIVTCPININSMDKDKFPFAGHTEFFESALDAKDKSVVLMVNNSLKVALLTAHTPISELPKAITKELIIKKAETLSKILTQDFSIRNPRIAILGLNPHAAEKGLGDEENTVIIPAIQELIKKGLMCVGPLTADNLFGSGDFTKYDAILAMYHDQGMIPFKTISMNSGVTYLANLPIIRTAPIHGVDYAIAGKNMASEESFRNAIYMASDIFHNRATHEKISANPLQKQEVEKGGYRE